MALSLVKKFKFRRAEEGRKEVGRRQEGDPSDCPDAERKDRPFCLAIDHS